MRKTRNNQKLPIFEKAKGYIYILVSILLIVSLIRNISRIRKADERIERAKERVENLEQQRSELEKRLGEAQSQIYLETQLRDGLGLAKEDEVVIVLPEDEVLRRIAPDIEESLEIEEELPNWKKWLALFTTLE